MTIPTPAADNHSTQPRPRYEVADIFRLYGADFRRGHALTRGQLKVMRCVEACRTAEMGGHIEECGHCGLRRPVYNSCRNRHCPKCKKLATAEWLKARQDELLPVGYFHNVFTLPHELNPLAAANPRLLYGQLFRSVAATLDGAGRRSPAWPGRLAGLHVGAAYLGSAVAVSRASALHHRRRRCSGR